jgi:hypothetical protein
MALPPLALVSDLAAWLGRDIDPGDGRAGAVLSHASTRVRAYTRQTWVTEGGQLDEVPDAVAEVVVRIAGRVWRNPENLDSVTIDDGTKRWGSVRGLALTDEDREDLDEFRAIGVPSGLGVVQTTRGEDWIDTLYVPTGPPPSGYDFPWYAADDPLLG